MKMFGIRLLLTVFLLTILELIVINIAGLLPLLAEHKADISESPFMDFIVANLTHPIETITSLIEKKNPLFFIGSGAVIILSFYVAFFAKGSKSKYELADKYGVHGSSRFAEGHEIFRPGETVGVPVKHLIRDLEASMLGSKGDK